MCSDACGILQDVGGKGQAELRKAAEALMQPCPITVWGTDKIDIAVSTPFLSPQSVCGGREFGHDDGLHYFFCAQAEQNALKNEQLPEFPAVVHKPEGLEV
jgi:hypothetical protein